MSRTPAFLAALASSAVPGLDPVSVRVARHDGTRHHEVAFVTDTQDRQWVVRAPVTPAAGAEMDTTVALLGLLSRRLPFAVPAPRGFAPVPEGRAVVYPYIAGRPIDFASVPPGAGLAADIGRALAALHNIDRLVFDEAGMPAYDAEEYRTRKLADLDRAAATGRVPTALLSRWERALEDVSTWRFAPTPVHGGITGDQVLVVFEDESDARSGTVRGLTGWDDAKVADPAEDFASLITVCSPEAFESVVEAYAHSRIERPDRHLRQRARLAAELGLVQALLRAVSGSHRRRVEQCAADLRDLDEATIDETPETDEVDDREPPARAARHLAAPPAGPPASPLRPAAPPPVSPDPRAGTPPVGSDGDAAPSDSNQTQPIHAGWFSDPTIVIAERSAAPDSPTSAPSDDAPSSQSEQDPPEGLADVAQTVGASDPLARASTVETGDASTEPGEDEPADESVRHVQAAPAKPADASLPESDAMAEPASPDEEPAYREPPDRFR